MERRCIVNLPCLPHLLVAPQARNEILEKVARLKQSPDAKPQHLTCETPLEEETRLVSEPSINKSHTVLRAACIQRVGGKSRTCIKQEVRIRLGSMHALVFQQHAG